MDTEGSDSERQRQLALEDANNGAQRLTVGGDAVALDHLGPIVINLDGTLTRIANWAEMTEREQAITKRRVAKRNLERKANLEQGTVPAAQPVLKQPAPSAAPSAAPTGEGMQAQQVMLNAAEALRAGRIDESVALYSRARRTLESSTGATEMGATTASTELLVQCMCELAHAHAQRHDYKDAISVYGDALRHDPGCASARLRRALMLESTGRIDDMASALSELESVLAQQGGGAGQCLSPRDLALANQAKNRVSRGLASEEANVALFPPDDGLVRSDQLLRLNLTEGGLFTGMGAAGGDEAEGGPGGLLPLGRPTRLKLVCANELGIWRRADIQGLCEEAGATAAGVPLSVSLVQWRPLCVGAAAADDEGEGEGVATTPAQGLRLQVLAAGTTEPELETSRRRRSTAPATSDTLAATGGDPEVVIGAAGKLLLEVCIIRVAEEEDTGDVDSSSQPPRRSDGAAALVQLRVEVAAGYTLSRPIVGVYSLPLQVTGAATAPGGDGGDDDAAAAAAAAAAQSVAEVRCAANQIALSSKIVRADTARVLSLGGSVGGGVGGGAGSSMAWRLLGAEAGAHLGIGGKLWDSTFSLVQFLCDEQASARAVGRRGCLEGRTVLELGAGTGLLGAACARLGCASVTVTDLPSSVPLLALNLGLNFGFDSSSGGGGGGAGDGRPDVAALPLAWAEPVSSDVLQRVGPLPFVEWLLLCDVVYEPSLFPLLLSTLRELCSAQTTILMAYRRRNPDEHQFFEALHAAGFACTPVQLLRDGTWDPEDGAAAAAAMSSEGGGEAWVTSPGSHILRIHCTAAVSAL